MKFDTLAAILASATAALAAPSISVDHAHAPSLIDAAIARMSSQFIMDGHRLATRQMPTCQNGEQCRAGAVVSGGGYTQVMGTLELPELPRRTVGYSYALITIGCNSQPIAVGVRFIPPGDIGHSTYDIYALGPPHAWQDPSQVPQGPDSYKAGDRLIMSIMIPTPVMGGIISVENQRTGNVRQIFLPAGQQCDSEAAWLFYDQMASHTWFAASTNKGGLQGAKIYDATRGSQTMSKCTLETPSTLTCLLIGGPKRKASVQ